MIKHGMSYTAEYRIWRAMKSRCLNPRNVMYELYGGRGITVYDMWIHDFTAFYDYMGPRPSARHSIDRVNPERGYEPGNVRWATPAEQGRTRRNSINILEDGKMVSLRDLAAKYGIPEGTINWRWHHGRRGKELVEKPRPYVKHS